MKNHSTPPRSPGLFWVVIGREWSWPSPWRAVNMANLMSLIRSQSLLVSMVSAVMGCLYVGGLTKGCRPSSGLPGFLPRSEIHLERPGRALLPVELPVDLGDIVGTDDCVRAGIVALGKIGLDPFGVDGAVDHDMADMDVLRPELARHGLR